MRARNFPPVNVASGIETRAAASRKQIVICTRDDISHLTGNVEGAGESDGEASRDRSRTRNVHARLVVHIRGYARASRSCVLAYVQAICKSSDTRSHVRFRRAAIPTENCGIARGELRNADRGAQ